MFVLVAGRSKESLEFGESLVGVAESSFEVLADESQFAIGFFEDVEGGLSFFDMED